MKETAASQSRIRSYDYTAWDRFDVVSTVVDTCGQCCIRSICIGRSLAVILHVVNHTTVCYACVC